MLITNASLVTWGAINRILKNHALYIEDDRIVDLGPSSELWAKYPRATELDARGQYVMPGNICAHIRFFRARARGVGPLGATRRKTSPKSLSGCGGGSTRLSHSTMFAIQRSSA